MTVVRRLPIKDELIWGVSALWKRGFGKRRCSYHAVPPVLSHRLLGLRSLIALIACFGSLSFSYKKNVPFGLSLLPFSLRGHCCPFSLSLSFLLPSYPRRVDIQNAAHSSGMVQVSKSFLGQHRSSRCTNQNPNDPGRPSWSVSPCGGSCPSLASPRHSAHSSSNCSGITCFATVGMFSAVSNLGAGGTQDTSLSDTANGVLYGTFAVTGLVSGGINNRASSLIR